MTQEEYNKLTEELQHRGYRKYPTPRFRVYDGTFDNLVSVIEWLIKNRYINKEYLKQ